MAQNEKEYFMNQLEIYKGNILNYYKLWSAEKRLFDAGESSLFMINSRENSYINAQLKLNEFNLKFNKSVLELQYSKAQLNNF